MRNKILEMSENRQKKEYNVRFSNSLGTYAISVNAINQIEAIKIAEELKSQKHDIVLYAKEA